MSKITALILIMLSIGIYYTFTSPQMAAVSVLSAQADEYRNVLDNASRISATRDQLASDAETIPATERERLMKALPNGVDSVGLARELDGIASRYGIVLQSVAIDNSASNSRNIVLPEGERPYEKTSVAFAFVADYQNFVKFLTDLEKSLRLMDVREASFSVSPQNNLYEHKIIVDTYWLK